MTCAAARKSAPSMTKMPAVLKRVKTRKMAEWTGFLTMTMPSADRIEMMARRKKKSTFQDMGQPLLPPFLQVKLAVANQPDERGDHDVDQHQGQEHLPGDAHQLVVAEAGQRATQPDIEEEEDDDFRQQ